MSVEQLFTNENIALAANVCTILLFLIVVVGYAIAFARNLKAPWQVWVAVLLQITIGILLVFYTKPIWIGLIVMWAMIAINELTRRVYNKYLDEYSRHFDEYSKSLEECSGMVDRCLEMLEKIVGTKDKLQ